MTRAESRLVRDDQTSGRTKTCIACDAAIGEYHHILCHIGQTAWNEANRDQ